MAFSKPEPGLDEVLTEEALDHWADSPPMMEEAPVRVWPSVMIASALCIPVGIVAGILVADHVTLLQVLFVTCTVVTATTAVVLIDRHLARPEGR